MQLLHARRVLVLRGSCTTSQNRTANLFREPLVTTMAMNAVVALERIAFLLERAHVPHYRPRAFRRAAESLGRLPAGELERLAAAGELKALSGVGDTITEVVQEALRGEEPSYLRALEARAAARPDDAAGELCRAMRGDCHVHTNWSDGKSSLEAIVGA